MTTILAIESSCDETAVAIYDGSLRAHVLHSQTDLHAAYGGVVPELAARDHLARMTGLLETACAQASLRPSALDAVAYTAGPGLAGALLVGASSASGIALAYDLPLIPIHHMEAHLLAPMLTDDPPDFPFVALLVSGGHSLLVDVAAPGSYCLLGESLDDAVGEAFDKTASLLDLPYPGGPHLAKLASLGVPDRFPLPRPLIDRPNCQFSFSGLKTAVRLLLEKQETLDEQTRADIARAFEDACVDVLVAKCHRALQQTGYTRLVVAGGVSANLRLRTRLGEECTQRGVTLHLPPPAFCTDNAAMVAYAGWLRRHDPPTTSPDVYARWALADLQPPREASTHV
ncbi:MAG: tRNA (adenosine(37)-N6)-threonylcarbamoyltransferase complex transferase subunit TsaD [Algiphilus sp.]|uniref:tRNA (adenosine(37)-N6)-threonylcarbamoyltransferase complex transferase subunit TsaD n=1 Tax=Algiphilus sp. TaxID=1872431 RepID=UPI0032EAC1C3